ncbi:MAG: histidine phosphatase family protein [Chloroflexota bacterium]
MINPTSISLVRHGHVFNPDNIVYGRLPGFCLSELGREQAQAAAAFLRDRPLAAAFSSPQLRAQQTAEIILAPHNGLRLSISPLINEVHVPFDGWPISKMLARQWDLYTGTGPEYEQPEDLLVRTHQFLTDVRQQYSGQHVVAVTHGDIIAFLHFWLRGIALTPENKRNLPQLLGEYPAPASITTVVYQTADPAEVPFFEYVKPYETRI